MKAAVLYGPRDLRVETVKDPSIRSDEVLVRVGACGICGTDIRTYKMGSTRPSAGGTIIGHEFSGEVVDLGTAVEGCRVGDRVVGIGFRHCGQCYWCRQGRTERCTNPGVPGHGLDGAFAEYVVIPRPAVGRTVFRVPGDMSWEIAATIEPMSNACFFADRAKIREGDTVVVLGAGMMGQTIALAGKALGASTVIVSEPSARRRQIASSLGADAVFSPLEKDPLETVASITNGLMASVVFECSGVPAAFRQGLQMLRFLGRMMQVAYFERPLELAPEVTSLLVDRSLTLQGCAGQAWGKAVEMVTSGRVRTDDLITHRFALDDVKAAFEAQLDAEHSIKVIVVP